jgi:hypothetical protein
MGFSGAWLVAAAVVVLAPREKPSERRGLEADHIHPHSRGVWASVSNGQALCKRHNREKSARVPWNWQVNKLAKRHATYFLPNRDSVVIRHRPPTVRSAAALAPAAERRAPEQELAGERRSNANL